MKGISYLILSILLLGGYIASKNELDKMLHSREFEQDVRYLPSAEAAKIIAAGFDEALADFYWISALNYFGTEFSKMGKVKKSNFIYLKPYTQLISSLDPFFTFFYDWGATAFIYNGLPIIRERLIEAIRIANQGIRKLNEIERYDASLIQKGAFNYALDAQTFAPSIPYFILLARAIPEHRDMLLVGSAYAKHAGQEHLSNQLREEFLGYQVFESKTKEQLSYALKTVLSSAFTQQALNFAKAIRVEMEKDEVLKKVVEQKLKENPRVHAAYESSKSKQTPIDIKLKIFQKIDISRNWLPPEMHLLFSVY